MSVLTVRQKVENRPGANHPLTPSELSFAPGSLFSFSICATAYESDAAVIRVPAGVRLRIRTASVNQKEISDFLKMAATHGVGLKFSSEENGDMLTVWTFDGQRSTEHWETGLGLEVSGPRMVRLAAVVDRTFKAGTPLNVNVFGSVHKA